MDWWRIGVFIGGALFLVLGLYAPDVSQVIVGAVGVLFIIASWVE